jgi:hypothetical protein
MLRRNTLIYIFIHDSMNIYNNQASKHKLNKLRIQYKKIIIIQIHNIENLICLKYYTFISKTYT